MNKGEIEYQGNTKVVLTFPNLVNLDLTYDNKTQTLQLPTSAEITGTFGIWKIGKFFNNAITIQEVENTNPQKSLEISSNNPFDIGITYYKKNTGAHPTKNLNNISRILIHASDKNIITYYEGSGEKSESEHKSETKSESKHKSDTKSESKHKSETESKSKQESEKESKSKSNPKPGEIYRLREVIENLKSQKAIDYVNELKNSKNSLKAYEINILEQAEELEKDISEKTKKIEKLEQNINNKNQEKEALDNQINGLEANLDKLTKETQAKLNNLKNIETINSTDLIKLQEEANNLESKLRSNSQTARMLEDGVFIGKNVFSELIKLVEEKIEELTTQISRAVEVKEHYSDSVKKAVNASDGTVTEEIPVDNI